MKRYLAAMAIVLFAFISSAAKADADEYQLHKTYEDLSDFTRIDVNGNYDIDVIKSDRCRVKIFYNEPEQLDKVRISSENGQLDLSVELPESRLKGVLGIGKKDLKMAVKIYVKELESVYAAGNCSVKSGHSFESHKFYVQSAGTAEIDLRYIKASLLKCQSSGNSSIDIEGSSAVEMRISGSGSSSMEITTASSIVKAEMSGTSGLELDLSDIDEFEGITSGTAEIEARGKGEEATYLTSGASRIKAGNFLCTDVIAKASGTSKITANASGRLEAKTSSMASVRYAGNPSDIVIEESKISSIRPL